MEILLKYIVLNCIILTNNIDGMSSSEEVSNTKDGTKRFEATMERIPEKGHVLFFHHSGTISHLNVLKSLAIGLLDNGHKVTTSFYGKTNIVHDNYTEITTKDR